MPRVSFRNLRRRVFATIAIVSLVLCLATVGLWVRSYWREDVIVHAFPHERVVRERLYGSVVGRAYLAEQDHRPDKSIRYGWGYWSSPPSDLTFFLLLAQRDVVVHVPHWFLALLFAIVPAWWGMAIVRARRRLPPGCCLACGYDLRASPGRCPECGARAKAEC